MRLPLLWTTMFLRLLGISGCSHSNNLLLGRVEAQLGSHQVVVTDCYRTNVPQPVLTVSNQSWSPCRDATIVIQDDQLTVNGKDYGHLSSGDSILVDHGAVSTHAHTASQRAQSYH